MANLNKLSARNQCALYRTHLLNLRIGSKNRKRRENGYSKLRNCPHEINMYTIITHLLNLTIGLENRKSRERLVTLNKLSTRNQLVLLYNSLSKFENWIGEQKKSGYSKGTVHMKITYTSTQLTN